MAVELAGLSFELPVLNAGMGGGIAGVDLAVAVSEGGGLGVLGLGGGLPIPFVREEIRGFRSRSARPFGVNLIIPMLQGGEVEACLEEQVPLLILFWGDVSPWADDARRRGVRLFAQVGDAEEAVCAVESGAAGVMIQGVEAGGHVKATAPLEENLRAAVKALPGVPVIAAGGIATGAEVRRALELGATAVSMGTRFLATEEAQAHPDYKARVVAADPKDTVRTELFDGGWPRAAHRVLRNGLYRRWEEAGSPEPGQRPGEGEQVARMVVAGQEMPLPRYSVMPPTSDFEGDLDEVALYAGQSCGRIRTVARAADVMRDLARELRAS